MFWIKLMGKAVLAATQNCLANQLLPFQMGAGVKGGSQVVAHTVGIWETRIRYNDNSFIIARLDIAKAYNNVSRLANRQAVIKYFPELLSVFDWEYSDNTDLFLQNSLYVGQVQKGVRTGDVEGPALFPLALHMCLSKLKEKRT